MNYQFTVKSSSGDPYVAEVNTDDGTVRVLCGCAAGSLGQMCKHKAAIIEGDLTMLSDPDLEPLFTAAHEALSKSPVATKYHEMQEALAGIEREMAALKKREKALKAAFARILADGVPV